MNEIFECLIPQEEKVIKVKDFRPISLVRSMYKIIAKVLANRLKKALPSTISKSQVAFIAWRQIRDQALIANEAVEDYRCCNKVGVIC